MKKYLEARPTLGDLREKIVILKDDDDKKNIFLILAILTAVLAVVSLGVVYLLKTKMNDAYDEDWDYDWDDLDDECCDDDCCCTDSDVDSSVKVEQV